MQLFNNFNGAGGATTMLTDNDFGFSRMHIIGIEYCRTVEEEHNVGVLFQRPGFAEVGDLRTLIITVLGVTVKLRDGDNGYFQFFGKEFELAGKFRNLLLAAFYFFPELINWR